MNLCAGIVGLSLVLQVPPPTSATESSRPFQRDRQAILDREAQALHALAEKLVKEGQGKRADQVKALLPAPAPADGSRRFLPLPEIDIPPLDAPPPPATSGEAQGQGQGDWPKPLTEIRVEAASALFALANRAANEQPRHFALADECLRGVIARDPDHEEARRLLGFVRHNDGWATPYAVRQFELGNTLHPVYGWVPRDWVLHLENGELPGPVVGGVPKSWLPAERADALRRKYPNGWRIDTEHFHIQTNVPLSEAIAFGKDLEHLHELFQAHFADVIGESRLPLAQRYRSKSQVGEREEARHEVSYFATRKEFNDYLRPFEGPGITKSLGIYFPAGILPRSTRGHAFFFRDAKGELPVTATLHHEVSHQLLWESGVAGPDDYRGNDGNFWVFEGLGTYFETLFPQPDGSLRIGGLVGARNEEARASLTAEGALVPLDRFLSFDKRAFNHRVDIYRHYQQASALTAFLLHGEGGTYREAFLDYVRDAVQGRVRRTSGLGLPERLGRTSQEIDDAFLRYLKGA